MRFQIVPTFLLALPVTAFAQSSTFNLIVGGKLVGQDVYTVARSKQTFKLVSKYRYNVHASEGDFVDEFKFSDSYAYLEGTTTEKRETPVLTSYTLNKQRTEVSVGEVAGPLHDATFFSVKQNFTLLPPFDAGALQVLLYQATQASAPSVFNVYAPIAGGRGQSTPGSSPTNDVHWSKGPDRSGSLDGKRIGLRTFLFTSPGFQWTLYADDSYTLVECDLPLVRTKYMRNGFVLDDSGAAQ